MVSVNFDRDRALALILALGRGEPLSPSGKQWSREDLLQVAGACFMALMSHGPDGLRGVDPMSIPLEHREAHLATLGDDLAWAVRWCAEATRLAMVGAYDPLFEPLHQVQVDGTKPEIRPVRGVKDALMRASPA